jgi:hypothetical protein
MSAWVLIPCLESLRHEFDVVSPGRDKGADGSIGDSAHTSASDHTPDEDSDVLRGKDADHKNEVHALDIDSSGPWPGGWDWFNDTICNIVDRCRKGNEKRLRYVIWDREIAGASNGWNWRPYTATGDPHTNHVHFSAVYTTEQENDISPWGVSEKGNDMELTDKVSLTDGTKKALGTDTNEMTFGTLVQTIAIWAARGGKNSAEILDKFAPIVSNTTSNAEKAAALEVILGTNSVEIGKILAG